MVTHLNGVVTNIAQPDDEDPGYSKRETEYLSKFRNNFENSNSRNIKDLAKNLGLSETEFREKVQFWIMSIPMNVGEKEISIIDKDEFNNKIERQIAFFKEK